MASQGTLLRHIRVVHEGMRKYSCKVCGIKFPYISDMLKHERVFAGSSNYPFKCHFCEHRFLLKQDVTRHQTVTHISKGNPKPTKEILKPKPPPTPKPKYIKCKICSLTFNSKSLVRHVQVVHDELRPYTCKFCDMKFGRRANHRNHELTHYGPAHYPHKCSLCEQRFLQRRVLDKHLEKHRAQPEYFISEKRKREGEAEGAAKNGLSECKQ
jgi:KRAB domain-containing zinc finger protein